MPVDAKTSFTTSPMPFTLKVDPDFNRSDLVAYLEPALLRRPENPAVVSLPGTSHEVTEPDALSITVPRGRAGDTGSSAGHASESCVDDDSLARPPPSYNTPSIPIQLA